MTSAPATRYSLSERRREHDQHRERSGERHRRRGARPRPAVHRAYADEQQPDAPRDEADEHAAEDRVASTVVVAPGAEEILAVDRDANRPEGEEREGERRRREGEEVPRAQPRPLRAEAPRRAEEQSAAEPVDGGGLACAGDEGEHRDQRGRDGAIRS